MHSAPASKSKSLEPSLAPEAPWAKTELLKLQRFAGNQATARLINESKHASVPARALVFRKPDPEVDKLKERVAILEKRQKADAVDLKWRATFGERLASYQQATLRISNGINAAANGFRGAQSAQAQTDQMKAQVLGTVIAVAAAGLFEPLAAPALGALGVTADKIPSTIELVENPTVALISGTASNVRGTAVAGSSAQTGVPPTVAPTQGASSSGDAVDFLTSNLEKLAGLQRKMEAAFSSRSAKLGGMTDDQWTAFDPAQQEARYQQILDSLNQVVAGAERLKSMEDIASIYERYMWAAWLPKNIEAYTTATKSGVRTTYSLGTDIEARVMAVGIGGLAGVKLSGHWYSSNSPGNWGPLLLDWCRGYKESIGTD